MKIVPFNERCDKRQKPVTSIDTKTKHARTKKKQLTYLIEILRFIQSA